MTPELTALAWGCLLALVHIFAPALVRTRQYGLAWNAGARDDAVPPPNALAGRLARAQANFFETFPLFAAAALIVSVAGLNDRSTALGAWLWLGARGISADLRRGHPLYSRARLRGEPRRAAHRAWACAVRLIRSASAT